MAKKNIKSKNIYASVKRGDTIIEVMFAFAVFSLVAVISIMLMNSGVAQSEAALELVTARNEINAQAEAIRFVHDAYVDEATLPRCGATVAADADCQQYADLWEQIEAKAIPASKMEVSLPLRACDEVYQDGSYSKLANSNAFVLNVRNITARSTSGTASLIPFSSGTFVPAELNARILYKRPGLNMTTDTDDISSVSSSDFNEVYKVEGLWVIAVKGTDGGVGGTPKYYDFYIQSCWYPPNNENTPTSLDTVIRLYNPSGA